jgi:hypothetical protein
MMGKLLRCLGVAGLTLAALAGGMVSLNAPGKVAMPQTTVAKPALDLAQPAATASATFALG